MNAYLKRVLNLAVFVSVLNVPALFGGVSDGGQIRACVHKNTGAVRILSAGGSCNRQNEELLAWNVAGARGGLRVVDSKGAEVGVPLDANVVAREAADGVWVHFFASSSGVRQGIAFQYRSTDCSGPRYLSLHVDLPVEGEVLENTIYYPSVSSAESLSTLSAQFFDASGPHGCEVSFSSGLFGLVVEAPIPSFVPPLRVTD